MPLTVTYQFIFLVSLPTYFHVTWPSINQACILMLELWGLINLRNLLNEYKIHLFAPFIFLIVNFFRAIALSKGCILTVFGEIDPPNFPSLRTDCHHPPHTIRDDKKRHFIICSHSWSHGMRHLECVADQPDSSLRIWNSQSKNRKACKSSSRCVLEWTLEQAQVRYETHVWANQHQEIAKKLSPWNRKSVFVKPCTKGSAATERQLLSAAASLVCFFPNCVSFTRENCTLKVNSLSTRINWTGILSLITIQLCL